MPDTPTLASLATDLDAGSTTARALVDRCLANIAAEDGEGARAFLHVDAEAAIEAARRWTGCAKSKPHRRATPAFPFPSRTCSTSGAGDPRRFARAGGFAAGGQPMRRWWRGCGAPVSW